MNQEKLIHQFLCAELELTKERNEILAQLRDEKRDLLLQMLENNANSTRRLRAAKETIFCRIANNVLDGECLDDDDEDDCVGCGCGCGYEEDDDDDDDDAVYEDDDEECDDCEADGGIKEI